MILSKPQMFLTKFSDKYDVCFHGSICVSALPNFFKARYAILKAYKIRAVAGQHSSPESGFANKTKMFFRAKNKRREITGP